MQKKWINVFSIDPELQGMQTPQSAKGYFCLGNQLGKGTNVAYPIKILGW